ncbi:MAG: M23 family metallopeptidase [Actinobacteria bacterium]|nr:M23 family metallopeptidase [Actinomycetota bacterium]
MIAPKKTLSLLMAFAILFALPAKSFAYTYNAIFGNVPPTIMQWGCPLDTFALVTSKWNQPRSIGTNPHRGVDVRAAKGSNVRAVWRGWLTSIGTYSVSLQVDANCDGIKNDAAYYCHYYHLSSKGASGYYGKGSIIGKSGDEGGALAPHLHFGGVNANLSSKWYRNEVNYRWTSSWNGGKDVDSFAMATWISNKAGLTAYFKDSCGNYAPAEVVIFHRKDGTSAWTSGGAMKREGSSTYTYDFTGKYRVGTKINWLARIKRGGLSSTIYPYCWAPAKYDRPDPNPNAVANPYAFYTNIVR